MRSAWVVSLVCCDVRIKAYFKAECKHSSTFFTNFAKKSAKKSPRVCVKIANPVTSGPMHTTTRSPINRHAFMRGFWRGLAAPLMLYSNTAFPAELQDYSFKQLPPIKRGSLRDDWLRVGKTLSESANRHING